ncbi:hypothetical protein VTK73DRAFT_4874 [Phialemonium thermophilum]|uniref:Zn(2)-C6 fungal-type domain-containing protein n=1 Tax=Phialemonium thermophilum TaxID=223376 RepID=A0ABR3WRT8_9PEZI
MAPPHLETRPEGPHRYACSLCSRRKVKCDKGDPCSNCRKAQSRCSYEAPAAYRPRKRAQDESLLARLAAYEDLMRKHNVDFSSLAATWVASGFEVKPKHMAAHYPVATTHLGAIPSCHTSPIHQSHNTRTNEERCLWFNLSPELKSPPIQTLAHPKVLLSNDSPSSFALISLHDWSEFHRQHPEPRHIYRFWQIFVEKVNPLIKVVHVPTLQQRILDASWEPSSIPTSLSVLLFTIYSLAVTAISEDECRSSFGESRSALLGRYRALAFQGLVTANFLITKDFEVLQALFLFLVGDPDSEFTATLTAVAVRLGQKMGLHRLDDADCRLPFFQKEMSIRLWWQICGLDGRCRAQSNLRTKLPTTDVANVRLPLNVNDADLHPNMTEPPTESNGPTEMLCVLIKVQVTHWLRSSPTAAKIMDGIFRGTTEGRTSTEHEDKLIEEIRSIYHERYLRNLDRSIPLHDLAHVLADLAIARMRFKLHHPTWRIATLGTAAPLTPEESDLVFESALTSLEMIDKGVRSPFSPWLFTHLTTNFQMDAYIYVLSDLRRRFSGERVVLAWRLIEDLYDNHPELIDDAENSFFTALGDLTLEAWEARQKELSRNTAQRELELTPSFIQRLQTSRQNLTNIGVGLSAAVDAHGLDSLNLDWEYWKEFIQL